MRNMQDNKVLYKYIYIYNIRKCTNQDHQMVITQNTALTNSPTIIYTKKTDFLIYRRKARHGRSQFELCITIDSPVGVALPA